MRTSPHPARSEACTKPIRVLIAEDHTLVVEVLVALLDEEADIVVVGQAVDGGQAVRLAHEVQPDVVLLDLDLPELSGLAVARTLRATQPDTRIVILTGMHDEELARSLIRIGVHGYLEKTAAVAELVNAIRAVHTGAVAFHDTIAHMLIRQAGLADNPEPTPRESEVLHQVADGRRNRQIALDLGLSEATVEFHLHNLFRKLRASNRTELVQHARRRGWVS